MGEEEKKINDKLSKAGNPNSSNNTLLELSKDKSIYVREKVAKNPACPPNILDNLAKDKDSDVKIAVCMNSNVTVNTLKSMMNDPDEKVCVAIVKSPNVTGEILYELAKCNSYEVKFAIASLTTIFDNTEDIFYLLLSNKERTHGYNQIQANIAENPICPIEIFELLSKDESDWVLRCILGNPRCPFYIKFNILEKDLQNSFYTNFPDEIGEDILNPRCPVEILEKAITLNSARIRWFVASNENCPEFLLSKLSDDKTDEIRWAVVNNNNCSMNILKKMINDPSDKIRLFAKKRYNKEKLYNRFKSVAGEAKNNVVNEDKKEKTIKEQIQESRKIKNKRDQEIEELRELIRLNIDKNRELYEKLSTYLTEEELKLYKIPRTRMPEKELLVRVDNHYEIRDIYLNDLQFVDFTLINTNNLKVSGLDFRLSNISIDPQKVFERDLSNSKFSNENITFKSFKGCNLCGADISEETDCTDINLAIIDSDTKLPVNLGQKLL